MRTFSGGLRICSAVLPVLLWAGCDEATPPDMSGMDVPPAIDTPYQDPGRDLAPWDPGLTDPVGDAPGADGQDPDAPDSILPPDVLEGPGRIQASPESLDFGIVMAGGRIDRSIALVNIGETPVSITALTWEDGSDGDFRILPKPGFGPLDDPPTPAELAPGRSTTLILRYAPEESAGAGDVAATLRVATSSDDHPHALIPMTARRIARSGCTLSLQPNAFPMAFGDLPLGASRDMSLRVRNTGTLACQIDMLVLRKCDTSTQCRPEDGISAAFAWITSPSLPFLIAPGEQVPLGVRYPAPGFTPEVGTTTPGFLGLLHRIEGYGLPEPILGHIPADCDPYGACPANVFARTVLPVLSITPASIDFGTVRAGCSSSVVPAAIDNLSGSNILLRSVRIDPTCASAGDIELGGAPAPDTTLEPGKALVLKLTWHPSSEGALACDLRVSTGDAAGLEYRVRLTGTAAPGGTITRQFQMPSRDVDVLFVVDGSGSMLDGLARLNSAIPAFLQATSDAGRDLQMGVIGVAGDESCADTGRLMGPVRLMTPATASRLEDAIAAVVASSCDTSLKEQGLRAARLALSSPRIDDIEVSCATGGTCPQPYQCVEGACGGVNRGLLRPGAGLDILFFSDEDDQSDATPQEYATFFQEVLGPARRPGVRVFAIAGPPPAGCEDAGEVAEAGHRYDWVASQVGGTLFPICVPSLDEALQTTARPPWESPIVLPLGTLPQAGSVQVWRNDAQCADGFTVDLAAWTVTIAPEGACAPGPGDRYSVNFTTSCSL